MPVLDAAVEQLRGARLPPFYDEAGAETHFRIRLDKVFIFKAPNVGLHLAGSAPCNGGRDCVGACNRDFLPEGVPGRCD